MATTKPFIGFNLSADLLQRIDDFRYSNRISSRAKAIEIILRAGMKSLANDYPELDISNQLQTGKKEENDVVKDEKRVHL